jgi:hypothetical protein
MGAGAQDSHLTQKAKRAQMGFSTDRLFTSERHTVKNGYRFSRPQPACHLPSPPWAGIIKLFPAREGLKKK